MLHNIPLLMYFADICEKVLVISGVIAVVAFCIFLFAVGYCALSHVDANTIYADESIIECRKLGKRISIWCGIVTLVSGALFVAIPDKGTMYSYIGVKTATEVLENPAVNTELKDIYMDVKTIIHKKAMER